MRTTETAQMKSTRERILHTLLTYPRSTINDLAKAVGINPISVRHHLTSLQAESLIAAEEERHGVGRPRLVYFLTPEGMEHFPTRYYRLANRLLEQIKETLPAATVERIFTTIAEDLANEYAEEIETLTVEERLDLIKSLLGQEGFLVEWEKKGDNYQIHEITCPYYHVGQEHPEVCTVDQTLISKVLSVPAEKVKCVLLGDKHCTYVIPQKAFMEKTNESNGG